MRNASMLVVAAALFAIASRSPLAAQGPPPGPPVDPDAQFEAASIKATDPSAVGARVMLMPGRLEVSGVPIRVLLRQALRVQDYQITGAPDWTGTERYNITAKAPDGSAPNALPTMVSNLLKDRFKLAAHTETREMPIYALVLARSDSRLGPGLKPTSADCQAQISARATGPGPGRGGPPPGPPDPNQPMPCGMMRSGPGVTSGTGQPIGQLVTMLAQFSGRPVVDRTGLTGAYDFDLKWAPDPGAGVGPLGPPPPGAPPIAVDPDAPNLFTAVQEQLGLKLENQRGPVDVVVIDHIEKPTVD